MNRIEIINALRRADQLNALPPHLDMGPYCAVKLHVHDASDPMAFADCIGDALHWQATPLELDRAAA